jgi:hypothetical protein
MFTLTGYCTNLLVIPVVFVGQNGTPEERDRLNLTIKSLADEKEYQVNMNLGTDSKAPSEDQLDKWMGDGTVLSVLASAVRAVPFAHDTTTKDKDGNTKRYARAGRKVAVGKVNVEIDALISFTAYEAQPAGQLDLAASGQAAHGAYLKQQAEVKKRSNARRLQQAKERADARKKELAKAS